MAQTLDAIVRAVESSSGKAQLRAEPAILAWVLGTSSPAALTTLDHIQALHGCTRITAAWLFSMSWGLYQFMGETLYSESLYAGPVWRFLASEADQAEAFAAWCIARRFNPMGELPAGAELVRFATDWNGAGNVAAYVARLQGAA